MTKKTLAAFLAALLVLTAASACTARDEQTEESEPETASSTPGVYGSYTEEQAAANNAQIPPGEISLIQFENPMPGDQIAVVRTTAGTIRIRLFPQQAPKTVENFIGLAEKGFFNGLTFHLVIQDFRIQTGDPSGTGTGGESIFSGGSGDPGYFEDEFSLDLWNFRGAVTMANIPETPGTNSSQFFIVQRDMVEESRLELMESIQYPQRVMDKYKEVGGAPHLDWKNTVFGMVIEGMDVVDKIAAVETDENDKPLEPILIENVTITQAS